MPGTQHQIPAVLKPKRRFRLRRVMISVIIIWSLDLLISLAVYFDVSTDYLLMGRDYVNLHSRKRLEGVLQELSGIIADLQDV